MQLAAPTLTARSRRSVNRSTARPSESAAHARACANAYQATFSSTLAGPNEDGSFTLHVGTATGTFTAGLYAGLTFTASGFKLMKWTGSNGLSVYGNSGVPAIQNVLLSNGTKFERICTGMTIS